MQVADPAPGSPPAYAGAPIPQYVQTLPPGSYASPPQVVIIQQPATPLRGTKSKTTAALLAILLGGIGVHKFYLDQTGWGILYLLFSWTCVPAVLGLLEGIVYLSHTDQGFAQKYG